MKTTKLITAILALSLFACTSAETTQNAAMIEITQLQKEWKLIEVDGENISTEIKSTLHIDSRLKATGSLGCNRFFGDAELKENTFIINKIATTRRMCSKEVSKIEKMVSGIFEDGAQVQASETQLILKNKSHTLKFTFEL